MISLVVRCLGAPELGKENISRVILLSSPLPLVRVVASVIHSIVSPFRGIEIIQNDTKLCENGLAWEEGASARSC